MWMLVDAARLQTASVGRDCIVFVLVQLHQLTVHFKTFFYFIDHFLSFGLDEDIANIFGLWIINENEILRQHKVLLSVDPKLRFWIKKSDPLWVYCTSGMDEADELTPFLFQRLMGMGGGGGFFHLVCTSYFFPLLLFYLYFFDMIYIYVCVYAWTCSACMTAYVYISVKISKQVHESLCFSTLLVYPENITSC